MAPSKIRRALGHVKDQTSISLAKVGGSTSLSDLDVAIVKATRHEEYPAEERHIREILTLTSYSRAYVSACVNTLSRRLNKTKNWTVALKTLILIHRLLTEGDPTYEQEIFFSTRRGTRILNMSDFRDTSRSNSWDFSAFVRTFALYIDESLEFRMQGKNTKRNVYKCEEDFGEDYNNSLVAVKPTPVNEMKTEQLFQRMQQLQQLLERFLACRPTGEAKCNRVVTVALYPIVKESFNLYYDITETMGALIDRFMEVDMKDTIKIYEIFCRQSKQFDELDAFYSWCRSIGIARPSEFPEIEKITQKKLDLLDELIRDKSALAQGNENAMSSEDHADKLALALFDGAVPAATSAGSGWDTLKADAGWETALVQSASILNNLKPTLGGGFDHLLLDGMYQQGQMMAAVTSSAATGSASSVAFGSAGRSAATLALPAPPSSNGNKNNEPVAVDPFAASLTVAPPSYVQMSDMEKKQKLLMEEQVMWDQFKRNGMRGGNVAVSNVQQQTYPYNQGGWYTHNYY
ncbi:hypothetical protein GOBAR_DD05033 [Gossypium barbadense]|nr:hypothetical protein GOBAR_DD05033 [Gossypium barbadense]